MLSLFAVYKGSFISEFVYVCDSSYFSVQHGIQEINTIGFRTDEQLAEAVNKNLYYSNSDGYNIPGFSSSEEGESESAIASDNESNISIPGPNHRQTDVTPTTGFSKNDRKPRIPHFIGNPGVKFAVENEADVMSYFDRYIPSELSETVVDQTNLYAQQQIAKMPRPVTKYARSGEWKPVTVIEIKNSFV